ncbi:MAG: glycosyltransferase family 4 protein [Patescibacteria group bacterium]|jgi:glycosyltransferase involved in cell wall biosynthesis
MRIALIHSGKKVGTGAWYINDLIRKSLSALGVSVREFYPRDNLLDAPVHLKGLKNIFFFQSLLEKHRTILKHCDLIQGTTYTPIALLPFSIPVVSHFGSTTYGFLKAVPQAKDPDEREVREQWYALRKQGAITELNVKTRRPLRDVAEIEEYVAKRAEGVIATSQGVVEELQEMGVKTEHIRLIHNAIEDYWFLPNKHTGETTPGVVFLGRLGGDVFTLKLKGFDRLAHIFLKLPSVPKMIVGMTDSKTLIPWMETHFKNTVLQLNTLKEQIPALLDAWSGSVLFISSRYEGFSLSLIEGMSRGLVPVTFAVGVAPEIIVNGKNGYIVHSTKEAQTVIKQLLQDNALRTRLSQEARATAEVFTTKRMAQQMKAFYTEIIAQDRSAKKKK